jgi:hypothetical protein
MTLVGLRPAHFAGTGNLKTLGSSTISLDFRHNYSAISNRPKAIAKHILSPVSCQVIFGEKGGKPLTLQIVEFRLQIKKHW